MNEVQLNAVAALEAALKRCANVGVSLYGVDSDLLAYTGTGGLPIQKILNSEDMVRVRDHGSYVDSGR